MEDNQMDRYALLIIIIIFFNCAGTLKQPVKLLNNREFMEKCLDMNIKHAVQIPDSIHSVAICSQSNHPYLFLAQSKISGELKKSNIRIWECSSKIRPYLEIEIQTFYISYKKISSGFLFQRDCIERKGEYLITGKLFSPEGEEIKNYLFNGSLTDSIYHDQLETVSVQPPIFKGPYEQKRNIILEGALVIAAALTSIYLFYVDKNPD